MKKTMNLPEFAKALGISRSLAYKLAAEGKIPVIRFGQKRIVVPLWAVDKMLKEATGSIPLTSTKETAIFTE